jgi:hypothetical protein
MAARPPLPREEVQRVLARLSPLSADGKIVLIGGQAVAWWTYFLGLAQGSAEDEIFTSEDIDFEGAARSAEIAAELIGGEVRLPRIDHLTPNTGQVLFTDSDGFNREIDFLGSPIGLDPTDVRKSSVPMKIPDASGGEASILVMHPERCMESRIHNVVRLRKTGTIAMTQLRRSIACAREWSRYLLDDESVSKKKRTRAVLDLNERIFRKCIRSHTFRLLALEYEVEPFEAVLVDDRLPIKFRDKRYPQMVHKIKAARERAKKQREH